MVYRARVHPDAVSPAGEHTFVEGVGAVNVAVPEGASGIIMQSHQDKAAPSYTDVVYGDFHEVSTPMTGIDQGFIVPTTPYIFWFDPARVKYFNFWIRTTGVELYYKFINPARPI